MSSERNHCWKLELGILILSLNESVLSYDNNLASI